MEPGQGPVVTRRLRFDEQLRTIEGRGPEGSRPSGRKGPEYPSWLSSAVLTVHCSAIVYRSRRGLQGPRIGLADGGGGLDRRPDIGAKFTYIQGGAKVLLKYLVLSECAPRRLPPSESLEEHIPPPSKRLITSSIPVDKMNQN